MVDNGNTDASIESVDNKDPVALSAECLALVTGIFPKKPPTATDIKQALKLLAKSEGKIKEFLNATETQQYEYEPPPEQSELLQDLSTPTGQEDWISPDLPDATLPAWIIKVNEARAYCSDQWPKYDANTITPSYYDLADDELGDIWEVVRALDSSDTLTSEMLSHTLSPAQVEAISANYPNFYAAFVELFDDQLVLFAMKKDTQLSIPQEDVIRTLKKKGEDDSVMPQSPQQKQAQGQQQSKAVAASTPISDAITSRQQGASK